MFIEKQQLSLDSSLWNYDIDLAFFPLRAKYSIFSTYDPSIQAQVASLPLKLKS